VVLGFLMCASTFLPRILGVLMAFAGLVWLLYLLPRWPSIWRRTTQPWARWERCRCCGCWRLGVNEEQWHEQAAAIGKRPNRGLRRAAPEEDRHGQAERGEFAGPERPLAVSQVHREVGGLDWRRRRVRIEAAMLGGRTGLFLFVWACGWFEWMRGAGNTIQITTQVNPTAVIWVGRLRRRWR